MTHMNQVQQVEADVLFDITDQEILAIESGPWAYMRSQQKKRMNLEDFRRTCVAKFQEIGIRATVNAYTTNVPDVYTFEVVLHNRIEGEADLDQQVHDVVNNTLELKDQGEGWISTSDTMREAERTMRENPTHRH